jgi:hypothetical protein
MKMLDSPVKAKKLLLRSTSNSSNKNYLPLVPKWPTRIDALAFDMLVVGLHTTILSIGCSSFSALSTAMMRTLHCRQKWTSKFFPMRDARYAMHEKTHSKDRNTNRNRHNCLPPIILKVIVCLIPNTCFKLTIGHDSAAGATQTFNKLI